MHNKKLLPLYLALAIAFGIVIGNFYAQLFSGAKLNIINASSDKINTLLRIVEDQYVDTVKISELVEKSIPEILKKLDPHSAYIPASDAEAATQELRGSFSGIGVQFMIYKDTIRVVKVIKEGPSERAGLKAGDCIVSIDGKPFTGEKITNDETMKHLKGPSETTVKLGILRKGEKTLRTYEITRGSVPVKSIDVTEMLDKETGYIRITTFGETTYSEFLAALATLNAQQFKNLVIDLRGNLGGYMEPAVRIVNEFLPKGRLIVYTEGRMSPRENYTSDGTGTYQNIPLVVLVDETSASSSEIVAGAIQDNDRGTVIGRRTFGKGLVQIPIEFTDGSMVRLTRARYYTPTGRCLQKPYTPGDDEAYQNDMLERAQHGEFFTQDSIKTTGKEYHTHLGRTVYGGGGVSPDVFIPRDTIGQNSYFLEATMQGLISQFAYDFTDNNRQKLENAESIDQIVNFIKQNNIVEAFANFAQQNGLKRRNRQINQAHQLLLDYITTNIINDVMGVEAAISYSNRTDNAVKKAQNIFQQGKAFPQAPDNKKTTR